MRRPVSRLHACAAAADGVQRLIDAASAWGDTSIIVGYPKVDSTGAMYNCAALINRLGMKEVRKTYVPNYNEFYERRWWRPAPPPTAST